MDPEQQTAHIRATFPGLAGVPLIRNREGLVHDVIIAGKERVFRFPKREQGRVSLKQEKKILTLLTGRVPVDLPHVDYEDEWMVSYRYLPGRPFLAADWDRLPELRTKQVI